MPIDLSEVGAHSDGTRVRLGVFLPGVRAGAGYRLTARLIHERDQFDPAVSSLSVPLADLGGADGLWQVEVPIADLAGAGHAGEPGRYLYRYRLEQDERVVVPAFTDPFAREAGPGGLSAFDSAPELPFPWTDAGFVVPEVHDLIVYELMVDEFSRDFDGVRGRLDYLQGLGVNALELMPVTNVREPFRWGYMPLAYFAIEERYGGRRGLQRLVDACHARGIAVIHDAVYAHAHARFAYYEVYRGLAVENPMMGRFAGDMFGEGPDFRKPFAREYFAAVNRYFIDALHCDGFRYDYVPGYYDGPVGQGYAKLVYDTYQYTRTLHETGHRRFLASGGTRSRVIQAAEFLDMPKDVLRVTHTNLSKRWWPMLKAQDMAGRPGWVDPHLPHDLLLIDLRDPWPAEHPAPDRFPVAPLQFFESHDRERLMYLITGGVRHHNAAGFDLFDRSRAPWYRLQPYAIALMTCVGVPLLWQGQEFGEFYGLPNDGGARVLAGRPLHWSFFYEPAGRRLTRLYRALARLRHAHQALRSRRAWYFHESSRPEDGLIAYQRDPDAAGDPSVLVLLNFAAHEQELWLPTRRDGQAVEQLNHLDDPQAAETVHLHEGEWMPFRVPSNYGKLFVVS